MEIQKDGYLYTYVANESTENINVWFDDFTVTHLGLDVLQSTSYYPFGGLAENVQKEKYRFGYQGQYAEEDEETVFNAFEARLYDPTINRWLSGDPARQYYSPYLGMGNNPINGVDPDGRLFGKLRAQIHALFSGGRVQQDTDGNYLVTRDVTTSDGGGSEKVGNTTVLPGLTTRSVTVRNFGQSGFRGRATPGSRSLNARFANFNVAERIAFRSGDVFDYLAALVSRDPLGIRNGAPGVRTPPTLMKATIGVIPPIQLLDSYYVLREGRSYDGSLANTQHDRNMAYFGIATSVFGGSNFGNVVLKPAVGPAGTIAGDIIEGVIQVNGFVHDLEKHNSEVQTFIR